MSPSEWSASEWMSNLGLLYAILLVSIYVINLIRKIIKQNKILDEVLKDINAFEKILTKQQVEDALEWYDKHNEYVQTNAMTASEQYPPTDIEDKSNPQNWKPQHWKWFLNNYG